MASESSSSRIEPVFFLNADVPQEDNKWLGTYEICRAVSDVISEDAVDGAQRIGALWRIYLLEEEARINLLSQGITLRGQQVSLKDRNPLLNIGFENVELTRLFIRNIPLSFDNTEIEKALRSKLGVQLASPLKYSRARTPDNKLTNFKTGDRFVDITVPDSPLPKKLSVGIFTASIYHKEQKQSKEDIECGNCMLKGHLRKDCKNEVVCYDCRIQGHKKGDPECHIVKAKFQTDDDEDDFLDADDDNEGKKDEKDESEEYEESESEEENAGEADSDDHKERELTDRRVSQMLQEALSDSKSKDNESQKQSITPKAPVNNKQGQEKAEKQSLISGFFSDTPKPGKCVSRTGSPAGRRKLDERSPDETQKKEVKKKKKNGK